MVRAKVAMAIRMRTIRPPRTGHRPAPLVGARYRHRHWRLARLRRGRPGGAASAGDQSQPDDRRRPGRHDITDVVFDVNLRYETNFSTLVLGQHAWETGAVAVLPLKEAILQDGIPL